MSPELETNAEDSRLNLVNGFTVSLIVLAGIGASLIFLLNDHTNYQETYNLQLAARHGLSAANLGSYDDPMPIYFLLERAWLHLTQAHASIVSSLVAARILSLVFYPLSAVAAYFAGLAMAKDRRIGLAAAMFLCLSPFMLWYSSRASMYSLLVFAVLINHYFYARLLDRPRWGHWVGYTLTALLGVGVHYFFGVILLVQLLFYATSVKRKLNLVWLVLCLAAVGVAVGLWAHYSADHTAYWRYLPYTGRPSATNTFIVFVQYLFGFQSVATTTLLISFWPLLVVVALLAIQKYIAPPPGVQYSFWAAAGPVLGVFLLSWIWKPLFLSSYLIIGLAPLMLFLAWYFVALNLRTLNLACYALMAMMALTFLIQAANPERAITNDYLGIVLRVFADDATSLPEWIHRSAAAG